MGGARLHSSQFAGGMVKSQGDDEPEKQNNLFLTKNFCQKTFARGKISAKLVEPGTDNKPTLHDYHIYLEIFIVKELWLS